MDRVVGVQDRISEVRARLQSLHRSVEGPAQPIDRPQTLGDQPVNLPATFTTRKPAAPPAMLAAEPPQPIMVQFSPEAERMAQHQSRKIDEQNRQISFLQNQIDELRTRQAPPSPYGRFVPGTDSRPNGLRPKDVQLQLSPGVSTNRRLEEQDDVSSITATPSNRARNFSEMQALLRAKINGQLSSTMPSSPQRLQSEFDQETVPAMPRHWRTLPGTAAPLADSGSQGSQRVPTHSDATDPSPSTVGAAAPQRSFVDDSMRAAESRRTAAAHPSAAATPSAPNTLRDVSVAQPTEGRRSGSRKGEDGGTSYNDRSESQSSRQPSMTQDEMYGVTPLQGRSPNAQLAKLSGAEVFAVLRLRGIVSSQGVTGEHLLPPTTCHMMYLSQGEYAQLTQLRDLLAATAATTSNSDGQGATSPTSARRHSRSPSARSSALAAFEKHRKRMSSVRESKAHSPAASKH